MSRQLLLTGVDPQFLHLGFHIAADLLAAHVHEGGPGGSGLMLWPAVLAGRHLGDDLGGDVCTGGGEKEWGFSISVPLMDGAVLQHVVQVDQVAVVHMLGVVVGVMEMDDAFLMGP